MNLHSYIDLYQLLDDRTLTHENNRAFALENDLQVQSSLQMLVAWVKAHQNSLPSPTQSTQFCKYLYVVSLVLGVLALVLGVVTGIGLLSYSGKEPVNLIYFLAVAVFIPLFTMLLALFSMLRANQAQSLLVHVSPAYWMEKIVGFFSQEARVTLSKLKINPLLLNWLVVKRSQLLALLFAIGLLLALLGIVATKDIAFAWSTTIQVSPEQFHAFLETLSLPWSGVFPSAVPSVDLIEQSQYFRLGEKLDSGMVANAAKLGEWWKFLACATLFYAIVWRFGMWLLASFGFHRALKKSLMSLEGVERLLYEMKTPLVTTTASKQELTFTPETHHYSRVLQIVDPRYKITLGWAMSKNDIVILNDSMQVGSEHTFDIGGTNTLYEDEEIISRLQGEVLLYVKSWEPPTMDLMDALSAIITQVDKITLLPVGTKADSYIPTSRELNIWERKIQLLDHPKVWLCRIN